MRRLSFLVGLFLFLPSLVHAAALPYGGLVPALQMIVCPATGGIPHTVAFSNAGSGSFQVVAAASGQQVKVYGYVINTLAATNVKFVTGTGSNCATGAVDLTGIISNGGTNANFSSPGFLSYAPLLGPSSAALCLNSSASTTVSGYMVTCQEP